METHVDQLMSLGPALYAPKRPLKTVDAQICCNLLGLAAHVRARDWYSLAPPRLQQAEPNVKPLCQLELFTAAQTVPVENPPRLCCGLPTVLLALHLLT